MNTIFIGKNPVISGKKNVEGRFCLIDDEKYYEIKNYDAMQPFFISLASDSNHWMYISSTGGLTAGRKNPDSALFPYYTDDKIADASELTGSKTILQVKKEDKIYIWEPFSDRNKGAYQIVRTIAKSTIGNKLIFTEKNLDLGLKFSYKWMNSDEFGWIKKSILLNENTDPVELCLIDGLQNVLPSGVEQFTQNTFSTLVDGYKKTELMEEAGLALFRMESILVDRAEPSESLRANTVWNVGLTQPTYLLSSHQLNAFRNGDNVHPEIESKGVRGAFFASVVLNLSANQQKEWYFVAEVSQDITAINNLAHFIRNSSEVVSRIEKSVIKGTDSLINLVAQADGIQQTADENGSVRHFSNVLFNSMRGGIYSDNYNIQSTFFSKHIQHFNRFCFEKHADFLASLPAQINYSELKGLILQQNDAQLYRLFLEYLPITFSRRHGDPSRPWNMFNINIKDAQGNKLLYYAGNWRDIFQNWEALSLSYPEYINGIIAKFLNATTADGYNSYRVTSEGIDWEVIEPDNPWSNIGYWGDHQIIYLLKLMEVSHNYSPESLLNWLDIELFAFANVPYRLKKYSEIVDTPKDSIVFDAQQNAIIEKLEKTYGADARLKLNVQQEVVLVTLTEKLLATFLSKLSNFIPEAGIWMNTLRPEWNDANNALVGTGASMVTLYYMRRFVVFVKELFQQSPSESFTISAEMFGFFDQINTSLVDNSYLLEKGFDNEKRRMVADELGRAGENYRMKIYNDLSYKKQLLGKQDLLDFFELALDYLDQSITVNRRPDNMYHAYNLVSFTDNSVSIRHLYEMLEGQVSVLSSGKLTPVEALELLDSLRNSSLYRDDQNSYILYPNKKLPNLKDKNNVSADDVKRIILLTELATAGDTRIISKDINGQFHFNASFNNVSFLKNALNQIKKEQVFKVTDTELLEIESVYEQIFDHQSFTGRSGTFYKYEGLGCIYWHMVSKLLLAIAENVKLAVKTGVEEQTINRLKQHYFEVKEGIGAHKSPEIYGSFPFDPYSHTPIMAGVQQPGMTGQVKEDIISRFLELGIQVENGCLNIQPILLKSSEFIQLNKNTSSLSFSYCSIPFRYIQDGNKGIEIKYVNGTLEQHPTYQLPPKQSQLIFNRSREIEQIIIHLPEIMD